MTARQAPTSAEALRATILADITVEEQRLKVAEDIARAALAELTVQAAELQAAHDQAAAIARAAFAAVPPLPELPDGAPHRTALHDLMRAREMLAARRTEALAAALPQVVQAWDLARGPLDVQAVELAGELSALAELYSTWHRLLREARSALEQPTTVRGRIRNGPSTRMRPRPGPHDVIDAALLGADLCGFGPPDSEVGAQLVTGRPDDGSGRRFVGGW